MATMDIFKADAFGMTELTHTVENMDFNPQYLGGLNLFGVKPVRQKNIFVDQKDDTLNLIGFSERGSPSEQNTRYGRKSISLEIPRIAVQDTVWAHEIAGLRATGTESELMSVQTEVAGRLASMRQKVEYTHEYLRLAAVQGKALNPADGSTYYNYYTEFGVSAPSATSLELDVATTDVPGVLRGIVRGIQRAAKGAWIVGQSRVRCLAGDDLFDALIAHASVKDLWKNWAAAAELRNIDPFSEFTVGGVTFTNYRGSNDNSEIAIAATEGKMFVEGGDGIFVKAVAPADEFMPYVNTLGQDVYAVQEMDAAFPATPRFAKYHVHSYPLYFCARPQTLRSVTLT